MNPDYESRSSTGADCILIEEVRDKLNKQRTALTTELSTYTKYTEHITCCHRQKDLHGEKNDIIIRLDGGRKGGNEVKRKFQFIFQRT